MVMLRENIRQISSRARPPLGCSSSPDAGICLSGLVLEPREATQTTGYRSQGMRVSLADPHHGPGYPKEEVLQVLEQTPLMVNLGCQFD